VKKIKILLIIVVLFIVSSTIVLAKSGTTTTDSVNLRNKPSTSSDVIKSLSKNESLEILEESGDFYKVLYKGRVGYVSKKFVSVAGESASTNTIETTNTTSSTNITTSTTNVTTTTEATTTVANSDNSNLAIGSYKLSADSDVYVLPVLYALKNGSLKKGDTVNIITVTANWVYISNNNISGWVFKTSIDGVDKEKTTTTTSTTEATTTTENVVTVNTDAVNIREKPSTSSDILGSVGKGRKLEVISKSGDWTQVQFNKVKGYVLSKFVS
jgi:mannosyl-glycoprotein endo-beta-N-acetylglucosaminidase